MFLIFGIEENEKKLDFDQLIICDGCGRYGRISVFMRYTYFMLFFIPLFKWNKRYYVRMECCGSVCEISPELGRSIEKGEVSSIDPSILHFYSEQTSWRTCSHCGYTTDEDFAFCPKCGKPLL